MKARRLSTKHRPAVRTRLRVEILERREMLTATLSITEVNYSPYEPVTAFGDSSAKTSDYAFIELSNMGDEQFDLTGVSFAKADVGNGTEGIDFAFGAETLAVGERLIVVEDVSAFQSRYGTSVRIAGAWSGGLDGVGETITLLAADGSIIQQFAYDSNSNWPTRGAGLGSSIEVKDTTHDLNDPSNWRNSNEYGGTPGKAPGDRATPVVINEILAHTDLPQVDTIEILNLTNDVIDIGHWYLTDKLTDLFRFFIPVGTDLAPNGYASFDESDFNPGDGTLPNDFAFSELGDDVWLIAANASGRPTYFIDHARIEANLNGVSLGRLPNGNEKSDMLPLNAVSIGAPNLGPRLSEVIISEIQYHPIDDDVNKEYIELTNTTSTVVSLFDYRIIDAIEIVMGPMDLSPNETVVLVAFDPLDTSLAVAFRSHYRLSGDVNLVGPWGTKSNGFPKSLSNGGEKITLLAPTDDAGVTYYWVTDQVDFDDAAPWPVAADGTGRSLERISTSAFGNAATSWRAVAPNPGNEMAVTLVDGDFDDDGRYVCQDVDRLVERIAIGDNDANFDINRDGLVDATDLQLWLVDAAFANGFESAYLPGDANLDGKVDARDLGIWSRNHSNRDAFWCGGDFNADHNVDASDLQLWNSHRFQSAERPHRPSRSVRSPLGVAALINRRAN